MRGKGLTTNQPDIAEVVSNSGVFGMKYFRLVSAYENKVLEKRWLYKSLRKLYKSTSFNNFVQFVIKKAEEKDCFHIGSSCNVDRHFR